MKDVDRARAALERAQQESDDIDRSLWLAKAADHAVKRDAVLVGGAAVNLHTRSYRPTDVDLCAYLDEADRQTLKDLGFEHRHGDHFAFELRDGERWLIEFPDTQVDGDVVNVELDAGENLRVISLESLIVDRMLQATDGTKVTFDEAVRLCVAVFEFADWDRVHADIRGRDRLEPMLQLLATYDRVARATRSLLNE